MKRKTLKIIGLSLLAGVIVGMGLLARPLVDRLVESVAATDQEKELVIGPGHRGRGPVRPPRSLGPCLG
jgi:hypothetical protein